MKSIVFIVLLVLHTSYASESKNKITFSAISSSKYPNATNALRTVNSAVVNGHRQSVEFMKLLSTGHKDNGEFYGLSKDIDDNILTLLDGSPYICNGTSNPKGSGSGLDHVTILQKNDKLYMVSQFECQIGSLYMNELEQNLTNGHLSVKPDTLRYISQKSEFGGYVHCAGMRTPWESHLGSEEYEPDARKLDLKTGKLDAYYDHIAGYWKGDLKFSNPYYYGWIPEVTIDHKGDPRYTKHYSMGRFSHELAYVMPDRKTVYLSDDGTNVGLYRYVADKPADLSAGRLYAAKWIQTDDKHGGSADLQWIELGRASDKQIRKFLDPDGNVSTNDGLKFDDIMEIAEVIQGECPKGFHSINTTSGYECIRVKEGMELAAAFLETRRYAAIKGATTEFRKEEGITFDAANNKLYIGMSAIAYGMEDNRKKGKSSLKYDKGGSNDIRLPFNPCGVVYALDVDKDYKAVNMRAEVIGKPIKKDPYGNDCHLYGIANPDNVTFLQDSDILVIGEDSSHHQNNIVWAYDVKRKSLSRIMSAPLGAETTSPFWYKDINGFGYLLLTVQHPSTTSSHRGESSVGVFGPFRNLK